MRRSGRPRVDGIKPSSYEDYKAHKVTREL